MEVIQGLIGLSTVVSTIGGVYYLFWKENKARAIGQEEHNELHRSTDQKVAELCNDRQIICDELKQIQQTITRLIIYNEQFPIETRQEAYDLYKKAGGNGHADLYWKTYGMPILQKQMQNRLGTSIEVDG